MTGVPVRHTQFASWIDEDAWMETMKGPRWKAVLNDEAKLVQSYTNKPGVKQRFAKYIQGFQSAQKQSQPHIPFVHGIVSVYWLSTFIKEWGFLGSTVKHECRDILITPSAIYCTTDIRDGEEYFELQCWTDPYAKEPAWKRSPVGPTLACKNGALYYLGVKNKLIFHEVWKCNLDGKNPECLYKEANPEVNLDILSLSDGRILYSRENSQEFEYYNLETLKPTTKYSASSSWEWPQYGFRITKHYGELTLWKGSKQLLQIKAGSILVDPFARTLPCLVRVDQPTGTSYYNVSESDLTLLEEKHFTNLYSERIEGVSKDGTRVYGILTYKKIKKPTKLLAIGYGAYGMATTIGSVMGRWAPLINSGWAVLYTFLRGGGDHTEEWAKAGRLGGRTKTIEDFEGVIVSAQKQLVISPAYTAIYGRSAGGLLMGGTLANHPNGSLMSAIYAEVPYVDELRTTTNTELPLTDLEHNEFGNPLSRLEDFLSVGLLSPADSATVISCPSVFILTRTAEHDSQVFAYESVKWIRRLRKSGGTKLCIVESGQGHFTPPDKTIQQWAIDCALLDSWISHEL